MRFYDIFIKKYFFNFKQKVMRKKLLIRLFIPIVLLVLLSIAIIGLNSRNFPSPTQSGWVLQTNLQTLLFNSNLTYRYCSESGKCLKNWMSLIWFWDALTDSRYSRWTISVISRMSFLLKFKICRCMYGLRLVLNSWTSFSWRSSWVNAYELPSFLNFKI